MSTPALLRAAGAGDLSLWVRLAKEQPGVGAGENTTLKAEVSRLKAELKRVNEERDMLQKAATYFAKLSG